MNIALDIQPSPMKTAPLLNKYYWNEATLTGFFFFLFFFFEVAVHLSWTQTIVRLNPHSDFCDYLDSETTWTRTSIGPYAHEFFPYLLPSAMLRCSQPAPSPMSKGLPTSLSFCCCLHYYSHRANGLVGLAAAQTSKHNAWSIRLRIQLLASWGTSRHFPA